MFLTDHCSQILNIFQFNYPYLNIFPLHEALQSLLEVSSGSFTYLECNETVFFRSESRPGII